MPHVRVTIHPGRARRRLHLGGIAPIEKPEFPRAGRSTKHGQEERAARVSSARAAQDQPVAPALAPSSRLAFDIACRSCCGGMGPFEQGHSFPRLP